MSEPTLSLWQKYRHWRFVRMCEKECQRFKNFGGLLLKDGTLTEAEGVEGYVWKLVDGREVTARDIRDAGSPKWLYKIYC